MLTFEIFSDADAAAVAAAGTIARIIDDHVFDEPFTLAVSGGRSPWRMLEELSTQHLPWPALRIFQVDERIAPAGDPDRNLTHLQASLLERSPLTSSQIFAMPVERVDLETAADEYASTLTTIAGEPPAVNLIHLGLGPDGHTASLLPGDPVLDVTNRYVAITGMFQGRRRMTLTYPVLNQAQRILWLVTGDDKADALSRLLRGDASIPAGRVEQRNAHVIADRAAARLVTKTGPVA